MATDGTNSVLVKVDFLATDDASVQTVATFQDLNDLSGLDTENILPHRPNGRIGLIQPSARARDYQHHEAVMAQNGLTPVSHVRHGHRFWKRFTSFDFARGMTECPVVEAEILHAAATFPITFRKSEHGFYPVAVLSLKPNQPTPFVSEHGKWLATYVPSALRSTPFQSRLNEPRDNDNAELFIDETSGLITDDPEDEIFFDKTGKLAPELKKIVAFFHALNKSMKNTTLLCGVLADMGLFNPLTSFQGIEFPHGHFGVDQSALQKIPSAHMSLLASNRGLRLIHAHQISMTHCEWLTQAQTRNNQISGGSPKHMISGVSGFLDALVTAQQKESALDFHWQEGHHAPL